MPSDAEKKLLIELRPVTASDGPFLQSVYASSREAELALTGWDDKMRTIFVLHQFAAQTAHYQKYYPNSIHQIIVSDGVPVGRLWVERNDAEIRILDLIVLTAARRQGTGTTLVRELQSEARQAAKPLRISVETSNPAREFFQRLEFTTEKENGPHLLLVWEPSQLPDGNKL